MAASEHHRVLVVGGGTAGITVAARLRRAKISDVALLEPSDVHWYQPLWTLVGGGEAPLSTTRRSESGLIPDGVTWIRDRAIAVDPDAHTVTTGRETTLSYDYLVFAPGLQLNWDGVPGLAETIGANGVSSNYSHEYAPKTWEFIKGVRGGTAIFTTPSGPIKCGGAPQKIAYLAADWWRRQGVLDKMRLILLVPGDAIFGIPEWAVELNRIAGKYGIEVRPKSEMVAVDGPAQRATIRDNATGSEETISFDMMHVTPPQSAHDWVAKSPLADPASAQGYVKADKYTLQSPDHPEIFALGDSANLPTSKTGAAVRKQAPTVVTNMLATMAGKEPTARYDGYTSCPLVTGRRKMLLAEFDYDSKPKPSIPLIDTTKERTDMWYLKRYGLPLLYWHFMLKGRA